MRIFHELGRRAGFPACWFGRLSSRPLDGTGKSRRPADRNVCATVHGPNARPSGLAAIHETERRPPARSNDQFIGWTRIGYPLCLHKLAILACLVVAGVGQEHGREKLDGAFQILSDAVDQGEVPGYIALVARHGQVIRHEARGLSDLENHIPFATNTLCWIASITKPVTVAAAMTLVDAGKIALDDPVEKYLPEFRAQTDTNGVHHAFTIRQIMSHTSGLVPNPPTRRSAWPIGGPLDDFWLEQELPEIVQTIARSQLRFKSGSKLEYSNSALFALGRVIEAVSGQPYDVFVKRRILDPLRMSDTTYAPSPAEAKRVAVIYGRRQGQRETVFRFNPAVKITNSAPDGGLFSYPSQLVPFFQMFLENDERVLSRAAMAVRAPFDCSFAWFRRPLRVTEFARLRRPSPAATTDSAFLPRLRWRNRTTGSPGRPARALPE